MTYKSSLDCLRNLPVVFTLNTAASEIGCDTSVASTYIGRWKQKNLVSSLGARTGVHFNLLINPSAAEDLRYDAIAFVYPGSIQGGVGALHRAGWTTQIPQEMDLLVPSRRSYPQIDHVAIHGRPMKFMRTARDWIATEGPVPTLHPALALADCVARGIWMPDPDDIEWDEVDVPALERAFDCLEVDLPEIWEDDLHYARTRAGPESHC